MDNIPNMWKVLKFHGSSHHQPVNLTKITSFAEILHDIPGMMKPPSGVVCSARIDLEKTWKNSVHQLGLTWDCPLVIQHSH